MTDEVYMEFDVDGKVEITTNMKGVKCLEATKDIEEALGIVQKKTKTPAYHQKAELKAKATVKRA